MFVRLLKEHWRSILCVVVAMLFFYLGILVNNVTRDCYVEMNAYVQDTAQKVKDLAKEQEFVVVEQDVKKI